MSETPTERMHRLVLETVVFGVRDELVAACKAEDLTGVGFAIMLYDFGDDGALAYASNGNRQDMIKLLKETLDKLQRSA